MNRSVLAAAVATALAAGTASADEVVFNNGDRLTGTVVSAEGGKLTIKSAVAGEIKVDMKDVKTFSTDQPVELKMADGSVIKDQVKAAPEGSGQVETAGTGNVRAQPVSLTEVKQINPPPVRWTGSVLAGGLITRGNSDTDSFNVGADAVRRSEDDRTTVSAGYLYGRQKVPGGDKVTTVDNWFGAAKYDYFFAPKWYAYATMRVERDNIADLDLRVMPGLGVGYQWIEKPDLNFSTEAGVNWVYEQYADDGTEDHFAARLAYHFDKKINDRVTLFHNLEFLPSVEDVSDYNVNADLGLRVSLTKRMFSEVKAEWRRDETPAPGKTKDDLRYLLSLGWGF